VRNRKSPVISPAPDGYNITGMKFYLRALRYRNYRLFFGGQGISLIGTWMQRIALSWLVYRLTNSVFLLGIVGFLGQFPTFLMAPVAGVMADRWNRFRIFLITQILATIQALVLAVLVITGVISVWHIIVLSIVLALINAFDMPSRQSFIIELVEKKEDLVNAIAMNSAMFNGARLVGPSIAGILIAVVGEGMCFLLNGISYFAVIIALFFMKITPRIPEKGDRNILRNLKEGFTYAFSRPSIRSVLILIAMGSLLGMPYAVLAPVFARDILHGGPHTLGFLMAATGIGALAGALYLASRKSAQGLEKVIPIATVILGVGLVGFALSQILWLSLVAMIVIGFGMMVQMASGNTVLQTIVDDSKRGRVMSFHAMAFIGTAPLGSLLAGTVAAKIGAPYTLLFCGIFCILGALILGKQLFALHQLIKTAIPQIPRFGNK
jgi:MFS family permease